MSPRVFSTAIWIVVPEAPSSAMCRIIACTKGCFIGIIFSKLASGRSFAVCQAKKAVSTRKIAISTGR